MKLFHFFALCAITLPYLVMANSAYATVITASSANRNLIDSAPANDLGDTVAVQSGGLLAIGEGNSSPFTSENRYWLPFEPTAAERTAIAGAASVLLEWQVTGKNNTAGFNIDVIGLPGRTSATAVNSDFEAAGTLIGDNALLPGSPVGRNSIDITSFAKAQAANPANVIALRGQIDPAAGIPNGAPANNFIVAVQDNTAVQLRPVLTIVPGFEALIEDDFNNGSLATGGINGGFQLVTNAAGGTGTASESNSHGTVSTTGGSNDNSGLVSLNTFDAGQGFSSVWVVSSATTPSANGLNLTLQSDDGFFGVTDGQPNLQLRFTGGGAFQLIAHDGSTADTLTTDTFTLSTMLDGFTAVGDFDEDGWAITLVGLGPVKELSGLWTATHNFNTLFDSDMYIGGFIQTGASGNQTLILDRIGVYNTVVPEPASLALWGLMAIFLGLAWKRRKRSNG